MLVGVLKSLQLFKKNGVFQMLACYALFLFYGSARLQLCLNAQNVLVHLLANVWILINLAAWPSISGLNAVDVWWFVPLIEYQVCLKWPVNLGSQWLTTFRGTKLPEQQCVRFAQHSLLWQLQWDAIFCWVCPQIWPMHLFLNKSVGASMLTLWNKLVGADYEGRSLWHELQAVMNQH